MSDKFENRGRKDGVSGPSQDQDPQPEGHHQQQVEGAATQPNVHLLNQENPVDHPPPAAAPAAAPPPPPPPPATTGGAAAAAPVQENEVHHQPMPIHQDPVNPRPVFIEKGDGPSAAISSKMGQGRPQIPAGVQADIFSYESKDSRPPPDDRTTDEDPTYGIDKEEKCKTDSIIKSSRKRPGDDQDSPGLAKSNWTVGSGSTRRRLNFD